MANRRKLTPRKKEKFCEVLVETGGNVSAAAKAVDVNRAYLYEYRETDADFAQLWEDAVEEGTANLEQECYRRAFEGTQKPVYRGGELVGHVREYSDSLATFLLRGRKPTVYREPVRRFAEQEGGPNITVVTGIPGPPGSELDD